MRQDWIEFETKKDTEKCKRVCLRPEYILAVQDREQDGVVLTYDCNTETGSIDVIEPYEQVKQKIMDAEKIDCCNVVVEHFTREEYEFIKSILIISISEACIKHDSTGNIERLYKSIENKLNEILKEDK